MRAIERLTSLDNSVKYVLELADGERIEAVCIPQPDGVNLCISCQAGCANRCRHCATGQGDYRRDLSSEEIVEQTKVMLEGCRSARDRVRILFMGMGEPLLNYENLLIAVKTLNASPWLDSVCDITVSTSGILPGIERLAAETARPRLAVTIGATSDDKRSWLLVPTGKLYPLSTTLEVCRQYAGTTQEAVVFQYTLIRDFNDSVEEAEALSRLIADIPCEVHVIPFNEFDGSMLRHPTHLKLSRFCRTLAYYGVKSAQKPSFGADIHAGCGQLRAASLLQKAR